MKSGVRVAVFFAVLAVALGALWYSQRRTKKTAVSANAVLQMAADAQRDALRAPMKLTRISDEEEITIGRELAKNYGRSFPGMTAQEQALQKLPGILWAVLLFGSVLTVLYACLFGAENLKLHAIQVAGLSLLIALSLAAIADLSRPYQGAAHVEPYGFLRAQETLRSAEPIP